MGLLIGHASLDLGVEVGGSKLFEKPDKRLRVTHDRPASQLGRKQSLAWLPNKFGH